MINARLLRATLLIGMLILPAVMLSACNTIEGAGQDIKNTGAWIEKKVNEQK